MLEIVAPIETNSKQNKAQINEADIEDAFTTIRNRPIDESLPFVTTPLPKHPFTK